jgi:hypothetical protein
MAYNKFKKLEQLRKQLHINDIQASWLPTQIPNFVVSQHLLDSLIEATNEPLRTEKAKSEYIIVPVIRELRRKNVNRFSSFSGFELDVDKSQELTGFCDFIFSADINRGEITAPIFCLVEAKNDNVEKGIAQCGAEMYAAKLYNEREGNPKERIYGCVTTAFSWCFLKLENKNLLIDPNFVPLTFTEPHRVLAVLQWILDESLKPQG